MDNQQTKRPDVVEEALLDFRLSSFGKEAEADLLKVLEQSIDIEETALIDQFAGALLETMLQHFTEFWKDRVSKSETNKMAVQASANFRELTPGYGQLSCAAQGPTESLIRIQKDAISSIKRTVRSWQKKER